MNKKGFTLIELISIIVILSIIVLVAVPAFNKYIFKTEDNYYKTLSKSVKTAGMEYMSENSSFLPQEVGYVAKVDKNSLISSGVMEKITDSEGRECEEVKVLVEKTETGEYKYTTCMKCGSYTSSESVCEYDLSGDNKNDNTAPSIASIYVSNKTTNSIKINAVCYDAESKIEHYLYSKDNGNHYDEGNSKGYTFKGLEDNKEYTFKIKCVNSVGLEKESISINATTASLQNPSIKEINDDSKFTHAPSREIEITYKDDQIEVPEYYFSSSVDAEVGNEVSVCNGTENYPNRGTCSGRTSKIEAGKWYKTDEKKQVVLYDKEGVLTALIGDGNNKFVNDKNEVNTAYYSTYTVINIDKTQPTISVVKNPLTLGKENYTFTSNVKSTFGISGGKTTCSPSTSKKTGTYNVLCTALGNNGLKAEIKFQVKHSYTATLVPKTCSWKKCGDPYCCIWIWDGGCHLTGGVCADTQYCVRTGCRDCETHYYDCSYYTCPQPGSYLVSGTSTCEYR